MDSAFELDPTRLSTQPTVFKGTFVPADLERLQDALADDRGELRYEITAGLDKRRRRTVSCIIEGFVFLICQNVPSKQLLTTPSEDRESQRLC